MKSKLKKYGIVTLIAAIFIMGGIFIAPIIFNPISATGNMEDYVKFRAPGAVDARIQCQNVDTDNNNYLSCEAAYEVDGKSEVLIAECPILFSMNTKCRQVRNIIQKP